MRDLIPGLGQKTTRQKLRELEKRAGTLPVIFALLFTEGVKILVGGLPIIILSPSHPLHFVGEAIKFFFTALAVAAAYIYEDKRREYTDKAKKGVSDTVEKAKENVDKAKEKASKDDGE